MKIYTKGGDQGSTSLIGGERVPKYDVRVEAYGSIDELSAQTAMLRDMLNGEDVTQFDDDLIVISRLLMHTESLMALGHGSEDKVKDLNGADIGFLEKRIDEISAVLPPIERFTLPGGHIVVSQAHISRRTAAPHLPYRLPQGRTPGLSRCRAVPRLFQCAHVPEQTVGLLLRTRTKTRHAPQRRGNPVGTLKAGDKCPLYRTDAQ